MYKMKTRVLGIALVVCLSVGASAGAVDLVGTWIVPDPNPYLGQHLVGYPNSDSLTQRFVFTRENGVLAGAFVSMIGKRPVSDLKVQGQTVSFSQGSNKYHGEIHGNELQLRVTWRGDSKSHPYTCRRATDRELKTIEAGPSYSFQKLPLPALHDVPGNDLAPTPPMGLGNVTETSDAEVRKLADEMVSSGLRDAGYVYLQID